MFFVISIIMIVSEKPPWGVDDRICIILYILLIVKYMYAYFLIQGIASFDMDEI